MSQSKGHEWHDRFYITMNRSTRLVIVVGASILYITLYFVTGRAHVVAILVPIPIACCGAFYGRRGAILQSAILCAIILSTFYIGKPMDSGRVARLVVGILGAAAAGVLVGYGADQTRRYHRIATELRDALNEIKTLRGLLPICASCKKIRNAEGYWNILEVYISEHTGVEFSHGICEECAKKLYPDIDVEEI